MHLVYPAENQLYNIQCYKILCVVESGLIMLTHNALGVPAMHIQLACGFLILVAYILYFTGALCVSKPYIIYADDCKAKEY